MATASQPTKGGTPMRPLKLLWRNGDCQANECPSLYETDGGYVVQGKILDAETRAALGLPTDEDAVFVPGNILDPSRLATHLEQNS